MNTKTHVLQFNWLQKLNTKALFFMLASVLVLVFVLYVYLVNKTVLNVVAREQTTRQIATLSTSIGELEFKYISAKNAVTLDLAYSHGFENSQPTLFVSRGQTTLSYRR
jgi:cytochrome bd-type quinol oxidase subunit 2